MFIFSEKEKLRYAVVNVYKNGVYGYPCKDRGEAEWRASHMTGLAYRIVVKPKSVVDLLYRKPPKQWLQLFNQGQPVSTRPEGA